jgi:hypothetical protein
MQTIIFKVQGSMPDPYTVIFQKAGTDFHASCNCQAGSVGQYCKHRFSILDGKLTGIVSDNKTDVAIIASWLPGSKLEAALHSLAEAEADFEGIKKRLSNIKKMVARVMTP